MQILGSSLTRDEVQKYLVRVERRITQLESELATLPPGHTRARAFLHKELSESYTIADELRAYDPVSEHDLKASYLRGVGGAS